MARAVEQHVVAEAQHPLVGEFAVGLDRMRRRRFVERQSELPFAAVAVGEVAVACLEQRPAAEEMRVDEFEIEAAAVGIAAIDERQLCRRAEKIALDKTHVPGVVAAHAGEARLRLRAPAVRGHGPEGELAVPLAHRIDAHLTKHAEVPQRPFTFLDAREIEGIAAIEQQAPADDRLPRAHVQLVRQAGDPVGRRVLAVENVAVLDDDGVDGWKVGRLDGWTVCLC